MVREADWIADAAVDFFLWIIGGLIFQVASQGSLFTLFLVLASVVYLAKVSGKQSWIWKEVVGAFATLVLSLAFQDELSALVSGVAMLIGIIRLIS